MSKGRREEFSEKKLNFKKIILVILIIFIIIAGIVVGINKDNIFKNEEYSFEEKIELEKTTEKTIEDILAEFGGEVIENPKPDTYIVLKDGTEYTVYDDGEILEERITFWNGQSSKPAIDEVGNINIYSEEEFKWVADQVINGEENFSGVTITLRKPLDFGARINNDGFWEGPIWTSIIGFLDELEKSNEKNEVKKEEIDSNKENLKRFAGCFDGQGFSIRGIYVDSEKDYQGLFGYSTGTICNVTLVNSYISGKNATGGIVGLNGGNIENCTIKNTIVDGKESKVGGIAGISMSSSIIKNVHTQSSQIRGLKYVGGIVGYVNNNSTILESSNFSKVMGESYIGGISGIVFYGTNLQTINNMGIVSGVKYVGGIAGYSEAQMEKLNNLQEIIGEEFVGGLVGANAEMSDLSKSYNTGKVTGKNNVGGIAGTNNSTISSCYNTGDIKSNGYRAGGICGQNATDSFIYNSYNIAIVEGEENIGGITGDNFGTITDAYYLNSIFPNVESENDRTEEELKNSILDDLGEEFIVDSNEFNNGYPVLSWQI